MMRFNGQFYSILLICSVLISYTDGKGGSSSTVEVSAVTITQIGSSEIGKDVKLRCDFPTVQKPVSLFWFKGNDIIYAKQDEALYVSKNVEASTEDFKVTKGHFVILKVVTLDDSASFLCQVKPKGQTEVDGSFSLVITPHAQTVFLSQTVSIPCDRHSNTQGTQHTTSKEQLIWKKGKSIITFADNVIDSNPRYSLQNTTLVVNNITASDSGVYTCYFNGKRSDSMTITVYTPPVIVLSPLRGYRGIVFGAMLGFFIVGTLAVTCYIQKKPFKGAKEFVIDEE